MRIAVWGAGTIGSGLVRRLSISDFTDQILWVNRSLDKIDRLAADIKHGLAMVPRCTDVSIVSEKRARSRIKNIDILVLTQGITVKPGQTRNDVYAANRAIYQTLPPIISDFGGIALVVSNPVDLMTREIVIGNHGIPPHRIMGLGTVVETSRLKFAIADRCDYKRRPSEIRAFAIGSHDENFVPVIRESGFPKGLTESVRHEVSEAANRIKGTDRENAGATMFPVVEGCVTVVRAIASNNPTSLTVSVLDESSTDKLCYSMPCTVDANGWQDRDVSCIEQYGLREQMDSCLEKLRAVLNAN